MVHETRPSESAIKKNVVFMVGNKCIDWHRILQSKSMSGIQREKLGSLWEQDR